MKIKAYLLHDHAVPLAPAPSARAWATDEALGDLGLRSASGAGWELRCPYACEVTWNGGPAPEDIAVRSDAPDADTPPFVQSQLGGGLLSFYPGYQIQTEGPTSLWVRGPANAPKDGLSALEQIVDTALLPVTIVVAWQCTRPNQTVRFERDEPFAVLLPYPQHYLDQFEPELIRPDEAPEQYAQEFQQRLLAPAMLDALLSLQQGDDPAAPQPAAAAGPAAPAERWAAQLGDPPPVSCICPTYGRVALLEEAIESFLRQDYPGEKELIVLNDYPDQTLVFAHPEVRIVNVPQRFGSVGEKYQAAAALCSHDLIVVWHDDDIYLPHRLSLSAAQFAPRRGFFKAERAWFWNDGQLSGPERNTFHGGSCFSRALLAETPGYPPSSSGFDIGFERACEEQRVGATKGQPLAPEDLYYIYRWAGTGSYHLSAAGQNGEAHAAVAAYVQEQVARGRVEHGSIALNPHWKTDYAALVRDHLTNGTVKPAEAVEQFPPPFFAIPGPRPMDEAAAAALFRYTHPRRISVVLPALNESALLQRTVEQFQATLPADCEIIVVDNGSTDGSADFLAGRGGHCDEVLLIQSAKPLGVAGARNRGLAAARGEVIVFADAHIDIPPHWWQPIVATLNRPNVGVVGPGIGIMGKPEQNAACAQRIAEPNLRVEWLGWKQHEPYPVPTLGGGFMAIRRETLDCAGAFDAGMPQWGSEDLELCVRYWLLGYEVWVVPAVAILHYFRKENPLKLKHGIVTHNQLRVALLHFSQERIGRVVTALKSQADFGPAMAHAVDSDVWQRRAELAARRVRDDDWYFEKFSDSCVV
ncbi:MAG: glycosyltransferase [Kouleothrix sp.]|nr:glycosyltransferase [Kouleothrix sp.]